MGSSVIAVPSERALSISLLTLSVPLSVSSCSDLLLLSAFVTSSSDSTSRNGLSEHSFSRYCLRSRFVICSNRIACCNCGVITNDCFCLKLRDADSCICILLFFPREWHLCFLISKYQFDHCQCQFFEK